MNLPCRIFKAARHRFAATALTIRPEADSNSNQAQENITVKRGDGSSVSAFVGNQHK